MDRGAKARAERIDAAHVAHDALAEVVDAVERDLVALRHAAPEPPGPAHGDARVEEVVDLAVEDLRVRDVREGDARPLGIETSALADRAVVDQVERRRARREPPDDPPRQRLALRDVPRARAHPHAARAQVLQRAVDDAVRSAAVVEPQRVVSRVPHAAAFERDAPHALQRHRRVAAARRLVLPAFRRASPAARRITVGERHVAEDDVVDVGARVGVAAERDELAQLRARRDDRRPRQVLAGKRAVQHLARLRVVEPFARRVERAAHVLKVDERFLRVPVLPPVPPTRRFRRHRARRRIEPTQDAPREAPLVDNAHLREGPLVRRQLREHVHLGVRERNRLDEPPLHRRVRRDGGLRHVEIALVREARPFRPAPVHPQLFEVGGLSVRRGGQGRGPHAAPTVHPAANPRPAREHGLALADPRDRRLGRSGIRRREDKRLLQRVVPALHAHGPRLAASLRLHGADPLQRPLRRKSARFNHQFPAQGAQRPGGTQNDDEFLHAPQYTIKMKSPLCGFKWLSRPTAFKSPLCGFK